MATESPLPTSKAEFPGKEVRPRERRRRALVVDDSPDIALLFSMLLREAGYDVVARDSAYAALQTAMTEQFDLIVSDIGMPGMNGYELAKELRTLPEYAAVPLIAVTGFAQYADRDRAFESGYDLHLNKPVDPVKFIELVASL